MAPEQLDGAPVDSRTDVFAFGLLLHEMLTGQRAFAAGSQAREIAAVYSVDPPAPSTLRADVPRTLDRIAGRCLRKDPDERWQSMRDLLFELQALQDRMRHGNGRPARPAGRSRGTWTPAIVALTATVLSALITFADVPARTPAPAAVRFVAAPPPVNTTLPASGLAFVSPDGSTLAWGLSSG